MEKSNRNILHANRLYDLKRYKATIQKAKEALIGDVDQEMAYLLIMLSYVELAAFKNAQEFGKIGLSRYPNSDELLHAHGYLHLKKGEYDAAVKYLKEALKISPENPDYLYRLGLTYFRARDYPNARATFRRVLAINPIEQKSLFYLKKLSSGKQGIAELEGSMENSFRFHPNTFLTQLLAGEIAFKKREYRKAADCYKNALIKSPNAKTIMVWMLESKFRANPIFGGILRFFPKLKGRQVMPVVLFLMVYSIGMFAFISDASDSLYFWLIFGLVNLPIVTFWLIRPFVKWRQSIQLFKFKDFAVVNPDCPYQFLTLLIVIFFAIYCCTELGFFAFLFWETMLMLFLKLYETNDKLLNDGYLHFKKPKAEIKEFIYILAGFNIPPLIIYFLLVGGSKGYFGIIF